MKMCTQFYKKVWVSKCDEIIVGEVNTKYGQWPDVSNQPSQILSLLESKC